MKRRNLSLFIGALLSGALIYLLAGHLHGSNPPQQASTSAPSSAPSDLRAMDTARIRIITANIRYADPNDKDDAWPKRRELLVKTLLVHEPDLIGFQEVTPAQGVYLQREMKDFAFVSSGKDEDLATSLLSGLDTLAYRKDRFEMVNSAGGMLRPDAIQKVATENTFYTAVVLKDLHGVFPEIIFLNTHVRHDTANAVVCAGRIREILAGLLKDHPKGVVVVTGDMNHDRDEPSYAALVESAAATKSSPVLTDSFDYAAMKAGEKYGTYHAFGGASAAALPTDLIFTSGLNVTPAEILKDHGADGHFPTDHFLVETDARR